MTKILNVENISKSFREGAEENRVLQSISLSVEKGEFVSIMGPSGSGKSTLLFCVSGMDSIDEGKIELCESELSRCNEDELAKKRRSEMGFVFQHPSLLKNLSVLDNIMLSSLRNDRKDPAAIKRRALALMEKAGIAELAERDISKVSGGQLQRAGVCRALMGEPEILFCDEPTGALNSRSAQEIMSLFSSINTDGTAIMLVTHDAKISAQSERVIFMRDGKIASELKLGKYKNEALSQRIELVNEKMQGLGI